MGLFWARARPKTLVRKFQRRQHCSTLILGKCCPHQVHIVDHGHGFLIVMISFKFVVDIILIFANSALDLLQRRSRTKLIVALLKSRSILHQKCLFRDISIHQHLLIGKDYLE